MVSAILIADLHLSGERSAIVELFLRFLRDKASDSQRLFILGDLFEVWVGDDDRTLPIPEILKALSDLTARGTQLYFIRGNRDFLVGEGFCRETGATLMQETAVVDLSGNSTLLMHGDQLVTDDVNYQRDRVYLRGEDFRRDFLRKSLDERISIAAEMRQQSEETKANLPDNIMDVNQETVEKYMRDNGTWQLVHGHTHRLATHDFRLDGRPAKRIVLGDWKDDLAPYLVDHGDCLVEQIFR